MRPFREMENCNLEIHDVTDQFDEHTVHMKSMPEIMPHDGRMSLLALSKLTQTREHSGPVTIRSNS
jgi:hypothetical protein